MHQIRIINERLVSSIAEIEIRSTYYRVTSINLNVGARNLRRYEIHYVKGRQKKVVLISRETMTELTAWLIASLYEGAFLIELTALKNLDQAKEVASRRTIKKVRWNIAPKSVEKDRNYGGLDYLP